MFQSKLGSSLPATVEKPILDLIKKPKSPKITEVSGISLMGSKVTTKWKITPIIR